MTSSNAGRRRRSPHPPTTASLHGRAADRRPLFRCALMPPAAAAANKEREYRRVSMISGPHFIILIYLTTGILRKHHVSGFVI
uniref:Uncharacterized protein n=1 Tax=Oryza sativa subsp. japonica TaxID=39947 RepID=Q6YZ11_ORYSJ|nr:hypothetical protein [Oryza sativa Japonica Group]BAD13177.1 hypothetical protein [Oryza sativa Japonica Group]